MLEGRSINSSCGDPRDVGEGFPSNVNVPDKARSRHGAGDGAQVRGSTLGQLRSAVELCLQTDGREAPE